MATLAADFTLPLRTFALELELEVSRTVALVGPSGSGKTSALRVVAGLAQPRRGRVALDGETWLDTASRLSLPPDRRRVGLVFQDYALFPHLSVRANVAFGARGRDVDALLERFRIGHLAAEHPHELSGGERQRVALARALARDPAVLFLDEPTASLDPVATKAVEDIIRAVSERNIKVVMATHDLGEARRLAGEIVMLHRGRIVERGAATSFFDAPQTLEARAFLAGELLL